MGRIKDRWKTKDGRPTARAGKGLRWQVWYQVDGQEKCGGSYANKDLAQRKLTELESAVQRGQWVDPTDTTTVTEWLRIWALAQSHGKRTAARIARDIRNHIEPTALGDRRLNKLRPSEVQAWVRDRSKVLKPSSLSNVVGMLRSAFRAARADRLMSIDPFEMILLPEVEGERVVPLMPEQVEKIADQVIPRYRAIVIVQAGLGLRVGEALGLCLDDINFLHRTVRIHRQADPDTGELVELKTKWSKRTLPLPAAVADELAAHIAAFPLGNRPDYPGLLFHTSSGRPYARTVYHHRVFHRAVLALHVQDPTFPVDAKPHDLRHFFATVLLDAGEDMPTVAELLGHKDATLVARTYGHRMPGKEDRARKAIDAIFTRADDHGGQAQAAPRRPQ